MTVAVMFGRFVDRNNRTGSWYLRLSGTLTKRWNGMMNGGGNPERSGGQDKVTGYAARNMAIRDRKIPVTQDAKRLRLTQRMNTKHKFSGYA
jgi:hypothetical protein